MAKRRDLQQPEPPPVEALTSNPFARLAAIRDELPAAPVVTATPVAPATPVVRGPARAVVRYQRKGRGGKEATLVEQLGLAPAVLDEWCREFKRALGCGGAVEGEHLVFGGDQRTRLAGLLEAKGVRRITLG